MIGVRRQARDLEADQAGRRRCPSRQRALEHLAERSSASRDGLPSVLRAADGAEAERLRRGLEVEDVELPERPGPAVDRRDPADVAGELDDAVAVALEQLDEPDRAPAAPGSGRCAISSAWFFSPPASRRAGRRPSRATPAAVSTKRFRRRQRRRAAARRPGARRRPPGSGGRAPATAARPARGSPRARCASRPAAARARAAPPRSAAARRSVTSSVRLPSVDRGGELLAAVAEGREHHVEVVGQAAQQHAPVGSARSASGVAPSVRRPSSATICAQLRLAAVQRAGQLADRAPAPAPGCRRRASRSARRCARTPASAPAGSCRRASSSPRRGRARVDVHGQRLQRARRADGRRRVLEDLALELGVEPQRHPRPPALDLAPRDPPGGRARDADRRLLGGLQALRRRAAPRRPRTARRRSAAAARPSWPPCSRGRSARRPAGAPGSLGRTGRGRERLARMRSCAIIGSLRSAAAACAASASTPRDARRTAAAGDAAPRRAGGGAAQAERLGEPGQAGRVDVRADAARCGPGAVGFWALVWYGRNTASRPENAPPTSWATPVGAPSEVGALNMLEQASRTSSSEGSVSSNISTSAGARPAEPRGDQPRVAHERRGLRARPGSCGARPACPRAAPAVSVGQRRRRARAPGARLRCTTPVDGGRRRAQLAQRRAAARRASRRAARPSSTVSAAAVRSVRSTSGAEVVAPGSRARRRCATARGSRRPARRRSCPARRARPGARSRIERRRARAASAGARRPPRRAASASRPRRASAGCSRISGRRTRSALSSVT